jgi:CDP-glucose 4,6-dehydratase
VSESRDGWFWQDKRVLVTGAGGFVGSWLTHALLERGASVTVILRDHMGQNNFELLGLGARTNLVYGSVADYAVVERAINEHDVDTCFHLAAQALVLAANRSPLSTFESNVKGTWCLLEACRVSPQVERVVVASSDKAYGSQPRLPYTEDMPLLGMSPYEASKACAEMVTRAYRHTFDLPVTVARCANIYGGGDVNLSRLIPGTIHAALAGQRPVIRSDGTPLRDYLFVDDAVQAYLALGEQLHRPEVRGQAFNFGTERPVSVLELTHRILGACGREDLEPDVRGTVSPTHEIQAQYLDSTLARSMLGWQPQVDLGEGLGRTVDWYRQRAAIGDRGPTRVAP